MAKFRKLMANKGFTLIEILVVIVIIGVLSIMGVSKYTEFTTTSRIRGCVSNQNSIDKSIGVWESQNVAIPTDADHTLTLDSVGVVSTAASFALAGPAKQALTKGSTVLFDFSKDVNVFTCPERFNVLGALIHKGSIDVSEYLWISKKKGTTDPELGDRTRGTKCVAYVTKGPDGTTGTLHVP